ncbi:MAG: cytochrome c maturation protein CcmE [Zymomonas mobilis subsp. pomaceae]|uniref:Cytochrome c-type biogenesis protein CcmE n=1 Tax=Zymomonas mobilis subsp. pomaceae (strain ATCC 29192 / DSM 22645 / JCM 10191 / CCUG 17912 / NBRC 13757 / NCIMB 11200 / NRRL B-4491 / Barker I) TaxID=579138 RepID=F8ET75_ZYMMT|nr:cytochrome c maturation protein CcmE [Zymomonas mobilis]AEI36965.1 CcmE/CycJ protein [Zymomonas mobilis subsp. pomaceae ATCC 29192]MDX5948338.1 cytochrome c maturation protein CcmE [Zymomonas mobilis subsp. pomaceae]GEB89094.1 cytochrome c-type biogenesis protein CcmE [Zymomonas mobilis subsp. pomaceae]
MQPKHQRLILGLVALVAVIGAGFLALIAFRHQAAYFYTPVEAIKAHLPVDRNIRLGGMVERGSLTHEKDGVTIGFKVTDGYQSLPVSYRGIVPDLFREGSGVVADGHFEKNGLFIAETILAKHDERYMPPNMPNNPANMTTPQGN